MVRRKERKPKGSDLIILLIVLCAFFALGSHVLDTGNQTTVASGTNAIAASDQMNSTDALVYFLDVGQADSELIRLPDGTNILIDAGTGDAGKSLVAYLKNLGIKKIDYLIATHPHEDHIGGMSAVVNQFEIGKVYMPKVADSQVPTTKSYENLLNAISKKGLKVTQAKGGMTIVDSGKTKLEFFAPNSSKYSSLNSYSIVTKFTYGSNRILFTGDAESDSEKEMISHGYNLQCDVLKCGHHGSSTSTSAAFLKAASPKTAIISCGVNNDYGHPNQALLDRLNKLKITIYRTDKQNTMLARCTGSSITITPDKKSVIK